jgi:hypothetical protein
MAGGVCNDRVPIHLRDERKKDFLFLLDMREHVVAKLLKQLGNPFQFWGFVPPLDCQLASHLCKPWKFLAYAPMMDTNDVLNQLSQRQG